MEVNMKKIIFCFIAGNILLAGCAGSGSTAAYTDPDKIIWVRVGQEFTISLKANPTTGYTWDALSPASWLQMVEKSYKADEPVLAGSGGVENFRFKALGKGQTTITMDYGRLMDSKAAQTKVFTVEVS